MSLRHICISKGAVGTRGAYRAQSDSISTTPETAGTAMSPSVKGLREQSNNPQQLSAVSSQSVSLAIDKKKSGVFRFKLPKTGASISKHILGARPAEGNTHVRAEGG